MNNRYKNDIRRTYLHVIKNFEKRKSFYTHVSRGFSFQMAARCAMTLIRMPINSDKLFYNAKVARSRCLFLFRYDTTYYSKRIVETKINKILGWPNTTALYCKDNI